MISNTIRIAISFCILFCATVFFAGCGGGVSSLEVSNIIGPLIMDEGSAAQFSVTVTGDTGIKYMWTTDPPNAGHFVPQDTAATEFTAADVEGQTQVTLKVVVNSDRFDPIIKSLTITIQDVEGLWVTDIFGNAEMDEETTESFSVLAGGASGIAYEWSVVPVEIGVFSAPDSESTDFTAESVDEDTLIELNVTVTSTNYPEITKKKEVTINEIPDLVVGQINGPDSVREDDNAFFDIEASGDTGITYQWYVDPPGAGLFTSPQGESRVFTAGAVESDTEVEIQVFVMSDSYGPFLRVKTLTIIDGFWVDEIEGPGTVIEEAPGSYSVGAGGDTGITYQWSVDPPQAGEFDSPTSAETWFTAAEVTVDTDIELWVIVNSDNYSPQLKVKDATIIDGIPRSWAKTWGSSAVNGDATRGVVIDGNDYIYSAGNFEGTVDFDPGPELQNVSADGRDIFLNMFSQSGDLHRITSWGGGWFDEVASLGLDSSGNFYAAGLDTDPGTQDVGAFVAKLDHDGDVTWNKIWGVNADISATAVAIDESGNTFVVGHFTGTIDFHPGPQQFILSSNGLDDVYISKFDADGDFQWVRVWGGNLDDDGNSITISGDDSIYVTGSFKGTVDFDPGTAVASRDSLGNSDIFVSKFNSLGNLLWVQTWGGSGDDAGYAITVDNDGMVYTVGKFFGSVDFNPGVGVDGHISAGLHDAFLSKSNSGGGFQWAQSWGGNGEDAASAIDLDSENNIVVAGTYDDTVDLDPGPSTDWHDTHGNNDIFLSKLDDSGDFLWGAGWGGTSIDTPYSLAIDGMDNIFVAGTFFGTVDFDPGPGEEIYTSKGYADAFLSKFPADGQW